MASLLEEIADALARDALRVVEETGDEELIALAGRMVGASSSTMQEAFQTAVRVRVAEGRARRLLADRAGADWPLAPYAPGGAVVVATAPAPVLAAPTPRRASVFDGPPLPPDEPPMGQEPILEEEPAAPEPAPEAPPEPEPVPEPVAAPEPPPPDDGRIRPRHPGAGPRPPAPAAAPVSIEAALALATSLPRKPLAEVEGPRAAPLYPDVEIPDGDWG
jgi:hypothetical protein